MNKWFLNSLHGECFSTPCLSVREASDDSLFQNEIYKRLKPILVYFFCSFVFIEGVIELKFTVVNVFGNSIHFQFRIQNFNVRVSTWNCIALPDHLFFLEDRALAHTDAETEWWGVLVRVDIVLLEAMLIHHAIKLDIIIFSLSLILSFLLRFFSSSIIHALASVFAFQFELFDFAYHSRLRHLNLTRCQILLLRAFLVLMTHILEEIIFLVFFFH